MSVFRFRFGYQTPGQKHLSHVLAADWVDDEDSEAFDIEAPTAEAAEEWGMVLAQEFVQSLFEDEREDWRAAAFAHWIEPAPLASPTIPRVQVGERPDFGKRIREKYGADWQFTEGRHGAAVRCTAFAIDSIGLRRCPLRWARHRRARTSPPRALSCRPCTLRRLDALRRAPAASRRA